MTDNKQQSVVDMLAQHAHYQPGEIVEVTIGGKVGNACVVFEERDNFVGVMPFSEAFVDEFIGNGNDWIWVDVGCVRYPAGKPGYNSAHHLAEMETRALRGDKCAAEKHDDLLAKAGPVVWVLQYGDDSVGLKNGALVGIFSTKKAAITHVEHNEKHMRPGYATRGSMMPEKVFRNRWSDGRRNLVLSETRVLRNRAFKWFAYSLGDDD